MKKLLLFLCLIISTQTIIGQVTAAGIYRSYTDEYKDNGIDYLFVFNNIAPSNSIQYIGAYTTINWYKFSDPTTSISNQYQNFNIEDATGYLLVVDGDTTTIWVIDYKNYLPVFTSLEPENTPENQCDQLTLNLQANVPPIQYQSFGGTTYTIDREYDLTYNTKSWNGDWIDKDTMFIIELPDAKIDIFTPPLCDTKFKIEGDQFASDLQITPRPSIESSLYSAVAVECHITTTAATRAEKHEYDRPETINTTSGSAPLDIMFESNANVPVALYYKWGIYMGKELLFERTDQDQRYTFTQAGKYTVRLTTSSEYCSSADSVEIEVVESKLQVPYAFSPNGDGMNDEFRVAYKSLASFQCWVFNRWGRKIYMWTDPQKGWDGTINGTPAHSGAYFYIIEAVGSDGIQYNRKGTINLLRGKER